MNFKAIFIESQISENQISQMSQISENVFICLFVCLFIYLQSQTERELY